MDLTQRPPRSPRVRLGGFVILPRMLDKCRALIAGTNGEYNYDCPVDQRFLEYVGIDPAALKQQASAGKGDGELLEWIQQHAQHHRSDSEIRVWSEGELHRVPTSTESREYFHAEHVRLAPQRQDIATWFDLLDLDDYISFGGKP